MPAWNENALVECWEAAQEEWNLYNPSKVGKPMKATDMKLIHNTLWYPPKATGLVSPSQQQHSTDLSTPDSPKYTPASPSARPYENDLEEGEIPDSTLEAPEAGDEIDEDMYWEPEMMDGPIEIPLDGEGGGAWDDSQLIQDWESNKAAWDALHPGKSWLDVQMELQKAKESGLASVEDAE